MQVDNVRVYRKIKHVYYYEYEHDYKMETWRVSVAV